MCGFRHAVGTTTDKCEAKQKKTNFILHLHHLKPFYSFSLINLFIYNWRWPRVCCFYRIVSSFFFLLLSLPCWRPQTTKCVFRPNQIKNVILMFVVLSYTKIVPQLWIDAILVVFKWMKWRFMCGIELHKWDFRFEIMLFVVCAGDAGFFLNSNNCFVKTRCKTMTCYIRTICFLLILIWTTATTTG